MRHRYADADRSHAQKPAAIVVDCFDGPVGIHGALRRFGDGFRLPNNYVHDAGNARYGL
jgi:hypothetical protein